jgi:hypothetical protein
MMDLILNAFVSLLEEYVKLTKVSLFIKLVCTQEEEDNLNISFESGSSWDIDTSWNSVSDFIAKVEKSIAKPTEKTTAVNSIGYEELPRTKPKVKSAEDRHRLDEFSHSSWDDDTLSSNFCSDNDNDYMKRIHSPGR